MYCALDGRSQQEGVVRVTGAQMPMMQLEAVTIAKHRNGCSVLMHNVSAAIQSNQYAGRVLMNVFSNGGLGSELSGMGPQVAGIAQVRHEAFYLMDFCCGKRFPR